MYAYNEGGCNGTLLAAWSSNLALDHTTMVQYSVHHDIVQYSSLPYMVVHDITLPRRLGNGQRLHNVPNITLTCKTLHIIPHTIVIL